MVCFLKSPYWSKRLMLLPFADRLPADVGGPRFASPNARLSLRSRAALQLEILALRHQLHVLQHHGLGDFI